jgi:alpha-galactosidase/6-phospho-beta-glucosidase family protein
MTGTTDAPAPKICLLGAGGMSFGPVMVLDAINTRRVRGATMMLHDVDPGRLAAPRRFADRVNERNGSPIRIESSLDPAVALTGADFCLTSAEVGRWEHWVEDYEIPVRHGSTQITGENGGPGAVFHSLRSIKTILGICDDIARYCPDTFLVNLTNPLSRVTLAINTATTIRNVGMCHEFAGGVSRIAALLRLPKKKIAAKASGINHFTFFTDIRRADTGEDLYPRLRRIWQRRFFDFPPPVTAAARTLVRVPWVDIAVEQMYAPLVAHMFRTYGVLPCSVDSHIGEYVPFAREEAGWHPVPVYYHRDLMARVGKLVTRYGNGTSHVPMHRAGRSAEEVFPVIGALWTGDERHINAVNVPNHGAVPNLPEGAIVEVPATAGAGGVAPEEMPPIVEPIAEFMKTQIELQDLVVKAALTGDPAPAFEAVVRDPLSPPDEASCRALFDELLAAQADVLPF